MDRTEVSEPLLIFFSSSRNCCLYIQLYLQVESWYRKKICFFFISVWKINILLQSDCLAPLVLLHVVGLYCLFAYEFHFHQSLLPTVDGARAMEGRRTATAAAVACVQANCQNEEKLVTRGGPWLTLVLPTKLAYSLWASCDLGLYIFTFTHSPHSCFCPRVGGD